MEFSALCISIVKAQVRRDEKRKKVLWNFNTSCIKQVESERNEVKNKPYKLLTPKGDST